MFSQFEEIIDSYRYLNVKGQFSVESILAVYKELGSWACMKLIHSLLMSLEFSSLAQRNIFPLEYFEKNELLDKCLEFLRSNYNMKELEENGGLEPSPATEGLLSTQVKELLEQLQFHRELSGEQLSCIIFVKRRYTAFVLSNLINATFKNYIRSMHLVGKDIKLKFVVDNQLQVNEAQATAIDKFSKGQYHILVATSVAEEG